MIPFDPIRGHHLAHDFSKMLRVICMKNASSLKFLGCYSTKPIVHHVQRMSSNDGGGEQWREVLDYWFEPGGESKWFQGGEKGDKEIETMFGKLVQQALQGGLQDWEAEPKPSLALILLTDQFTRSIFRGNARSFAGDERARKITRKFLERNTHDHLKHSLSERGFIYLPMEHSENAADQVLSIQLCEQMAKDAEGTEFDKQMKMHLDFAKRHKEVIDRFGRYPQRNKVLGRTNTLEEEEFLLNLPDQYKW